MGCVARCSKSLERLPRQCNRLSLKRRPCPRLNSSSSSRPAAATEIQRSATGDGESAAAQRRPVAVETARSSEKSVQAISGPSMLGLDFPVTRQPDPTGASQYSANQSGNQYRAEAEPRRFNDFGADSRGPDLRDDLSADSFRERSFSGLDSYIEQEERRSGVGRLILLLLLLAALGAAGWWTYNNYLGVARSRSAQSDTSNVMEGPADSASGKPAPPAAQTIPNPQSPQSQPAAPPSDVSEGPSENAGPVSTGAAPDKTTTAPNANSSAALNENRVEAKPVPLAKPVPVAKSPAAKKVAPKREPAVAAATASRLPASETEDTGDDSYRKAEAYLYGRGAAQNCDEAVKNLKAASAKSNAKARSTFGTMYATGHCVPRDLPTSYLWFALALRVDPNNQILEKDLTAVWNQMTPPERQMATRMKQ